MYMLYSLQNMEESIRRPLAIDDAVLLGESDNATRESLAEVDPITLNQTINALTSQLRQMGFGTSSNKRWSDVPLTNLSHMADVIHNLGASIYTAGVAITLGQVVYSTHSSREVRLADKANSDNLTIVGVAKDVGSVGSNIRILHSGSVMGGYSSLVPGAQYFLGTSGNLQTEVPSGSGELVIKIGIAKSATELLVDIGHPRIRG